MTAKTEVKLPDREYWTRIARGCVSPEGMVEKVVDYMMINPGTCLWHASWDLHGRRGDCDCASCRKTRGKNPVRI